MPEEIRRADAPWIFAWHVWRGFIGGILTDPTTREGKKAMQSPRAGFFDWIADLLQHNHALRDGLLSPVFYRKDEIAPDPDEHFQEELLCYVSLLGRRVTATNSLLGENLAATDRFTAAQVLLLELLRAGAADDAWGGAELVRLSAPTESYGDDARFSAVGDKLKERLKEEGRRGYLKNSASPTLLERFGVAHIRIGAWDAPIPEELSLFDVLACLPLPLAGDLVSSNSALTALQNLILTLNRPYGNRVRTGLPFDAHFVWMSLEAGATAGEDEEVEDVGCGVGLRLSDVKCRTIGNLREEIFRTYGPGRTSAETVRAVWPKIMAEQRVNGQSNGYRGDVERFLETREGRYFVDQRLMRFQASSSQNNDGEVVYVPAYANVVAPQGASILAGAGAPGSLPTNNPDLDPSTAEDAAAWEAWLRRHGHRLTPAERLWIEQARGSALRLSDKQAALADALAREPPYNRLPEPARTTVFEFFRDRLLDRIRGLTLRPMDRFITEPEQRFAELEATRPKQETDAAFLERVRRDNMLIVSLADTPPYADIDDSEAAFAVLTYFYQRDVKLPTTRPASRKRS